MSPAWKFATVLQISAERPRSSTKNVSSPVPPTKKFEFVDPSSTLLPFAWLTLIASSPEPVWMKTFGTFAVTSRLSLPVYMNSD